jgi:hypothetical protein
MVSQCDTCHECHNCDMCHTCHKYQCHVSLVIQCVIVGHLETDIIKVWAGWVKSGFNAFGDYFVVSRRQKYGIMKFQKMTKFGRYKF